jgi:hypothetical protein
MDQIKNRMMQVTGSTHEKQLCYRVLIDNGQSRLFEF